MKKSLKIDILNEGDLIERYNVDKVDRELINYLIDSSMILEKKEIKEIIINNHTDIDAKELVKEGLQDKYLKTFKQHRLIDKKQLLYIAIGIVAIAVSSIIKYDILKEISLIGGWVFVWSAIELEITSDFKVFRERKIIERLLQCEIIEHKIDK